MSDQERDRLNENDEESTEETDVEAHKLFANDEDGGDDDEAHKLPAANDDDSGDDVEAHRLL